MSSSALAAGLRHLRGKLAMQHSGEDSDEQLLHAFTTRREQSAFAVLVRRHGPMVLSVCRRVLGHEHDAEDAFQATFLVLAQSAAALRKKSSLASWLHGTAYRHAMKAKRSAVRRRKYEGRATSPSPATPLDELSWREVRALLDEEITRLPEIYRSAFILCCLENASHAEAARRLNVKEKTISSRLRDARKRLARRLARRGIDTGKPIPGAVVTSYKRADRHISAVTDLRAVADKNGRYCLLGMPKGAGNVIRAGAPEDEPYLMATQDIANPPGLEPVTADFTLKRGVWISGRVLDKITRQPVHAQVQYLIFADNPHRKEAPGLSVDIYLQSRAEDGTFRVAALPGRGLLAARAWSDKYRTAVGADKIKGMGPDGHFHTSPHLLFAQGYHTLAEVNPAVDAKRMTCDLLLDPGHTVTGEVRGPDGKPLGGVRVSGLRNYGDWENEPLKTSAFIVTGLEPEQSRLLEFAHVEKKLAGSVVVKGDDKGPLVVKLVRAASLTGRLVTPDGKPVADGEITAHKQAVDQPQNSKADPTSGTLRAGIRPDKDGKFRIEGLVPGLTYYLGFRKGLYGHQLGGSAGSKLTFEQGQTRDLGDVVVKPIP